MPTPLQSAAVSASPPALHARRILYADDLPELRDLMVAVMAREGHEIEAVGDGAAALAHLRAAHPAFDLLITDHHMPGTNGLELVRQARALDHPPLIVVFSSDLSPALQASYLRLGVDALLAKPAGPHELHAVLERVFGAGHLADHPGLPSDAHG